MKKITGTKYYTKLPDKPSDILMLALTDLETVEKEGELVINMHYWMKQEVGMPCEVCLAGSVMVQTCKFNPDLFVNPDLLTRGKHTSTRTVLVFEMKEQELRSKLEFINHMRDGSFHSGFTALERAGVITLEQKGEAFKAFQESEDCSDDYENQIENGTFTDYHSNKEFFINHICAVIGTLQSIGL